MANALVKGSPRWKFRVFCGNLRSAVLANPWCVPCLVSAWGWFIGLSLPGDTLARPTYKYMAVVAPEDYWTVVIGLIALLQSWRLFKRTTLKLFPYELALKALAALVWTYIAIACYASQWPPAAAMSGDLAVALCAWIDMSQCKPCLGCSYRGSAFCEDGCHLSRSDDHVG